MKKLLWVALLATVLTGCQEQKRYRNEVCTAGSEILNGQEPNCKEGQILSYLPNRWGNEQLPILVSTYFCSLKHPIVQNNSGVVCVYERRFNAKVEATNKAQ